MQTEPPTITTDAALAGIASSSLNRLFELLGTDNALGLWERLPDPKGNHARAILRRSAYAYEQRFAVGLWPRLAEFLERLTQSPEGQRELLDTQFHDCFAESAWPYVCRAMLQLNGGGFAPTDRRLMALYARDVGQFSALVYTPLTVEFAALFVHPGIKRLHVPRYAREQAAGMHKLLQVVGTSVNELVVDEGVVPDLFDLLHSARKSMSMADAQHEIAYVVERLSFAEMLWVARWWRETNDAGISVRASKGERWQPTRPPYDPSAGSEQQRGPPRVLPLDPPLRGRSAFGIHDADWIIGEAERRKSLCRRNINFCPECHSYDPSGRHLSRTGDGYTCTKKHAAPAVAVTTQPVPTTTTATAKKGRGSASNNNASGVAPAIVKRARRPASNKGTPRRTRKPKQEPSPPPPQ